MTTAEKNMLISEYIGFEIEPFSNKGGNGFHVRLRCVPLKEGSYSSSTYGDVNISKSVAFSNKYHESWDWLMPVWQKLRGELLGSMSEYNVVTLKRIQYTIINTDLPTAHTLMVEAIQLINKNKKHDTNTPT